MDMRLYRPRRLVLGTVLATILALWLASVWVLLEWQGDRWFASIAGGQVAVMSGRIARERGFGVSLHPAEIAWGFDGYWASTPARSAWGFSVPLWFVWIIAAATGMTPAVYARFRASRPGVCGCGYPLTGLARCPECGAEPPALS